MKLNNPIDIEILEFFKTGKFDYLKIGQSKEYILNNFPDPDYFTTYKEFSRYNIWCYGNIELHFNDDILWMIFSDYIGTLNGGNSIRINKWILSKPKKLNLLYTINQLNKENIDFKKITDKKLQFVTLHLASNVELSFHHQDNDTENDPNNYMMESFYLK